jgi:hypothetical protein
VKEVGEGGERRKEAVARGVWGGRGLKWNGGKGRLEGNSFILRLKWNAAKALNWLRGGGKREERRGSFPGGSSRAQRLLNQATGGVRRDCS